VRHRISVLSWADGSVLVQFGNLGSGPGELDCPRSLRLLCDSNELVVAGSFNNRLCLFTVTGEFVSTLSINDAGLLEPFDVIEYGAGGSFITANISATNLTHVSRDDAGIPVDLFDSTATNYTPLSDPYVLAALPEGGLLVGTLERLHVFNGLNVRLAWITVCVTLARPIRGLHS
jgi:hypothetical protein